MCLATKFSNKEVTLDGSERAFVVLEELKTIWLNTGTVCNLSCSNCYIESTPKNDRLAFLTLDDVKKVMTEIKSENYPVQLIGITGGEPFINKDIISIITEVLKNQLEILILTNGFNVIDRHKDNLLKIKEEFNEKLHIRVSLDHYTLAIHENERGKNTFAKTLTNIKWLGDHNFNLSIAGRSLKDEATQNAKNSYMSLFENNQILVDSSKIVIFPEMDLNREVPEITTACWDILKKTPEMQMCSSERMVVKRKGEQEITILPCTLIAYDDSFDLGHSLKASEKKVYLNHKFCAQFCVLGGGSCSSTK